VGTDSAAETPTQKTNFQFTVTLPDEEEDIDFRVRQNPFRIAEPKSRVTEDIVSDEEENGGEDVGENQQESIDGSQSGAIATGIIASRSSASANAFNNLVTFRLNIFI